MRMATWRSLSAVPWLSSAAGPFPVARVSMDLTTFDVTDLPEIAPGDCLTLIGGAGCSPAKSSARGHHRLRDPDRPSVRATRDYIRG